MSNGSILTSHAPFVVGFVIFVSLSVASALTFVTLVRLLKMPFDPRPQGPPTIKGQLGAAGFPSFTTGALFGAGLTGVLAAGAALAGSGPANAHEPSHQASGNTSPSDGGTDHPSDAPDQPSDHGDSPGLLGHHEHSSLSDYLHAFFGT